MYERILRTRAERFLRGLPAFSIEGAKGVGKTTLAKTLAQTTFNMDSETTAELVMGSPQLLSTAAKPVLVDEWQVTPGIWNAIRHFVDDDMTPGQYILTGSSVPRDARLHSGAGRIVRMTMRPLSLAERALTPKLLSLDDLLRGDENILPQQTDVAQYAYVQEILASGFPGIRQIARAFQRDALDGYIDNIIEKEFDELGVGVRRPEALRAWMKAYAAAEGSTASYESIMGAATPGQDKKPSKPTTLVYRDILAALWITDPVLPWLPEGNLFTNMGKASKHYLVDPALSARLLDLTEQRLLSGDKVRVLGHQAKTIIGRLFESLVAQSLKVYTSALGLELRHLRTVRGDHEIDFIIESGEHILAIEVKFAPAVSNDDVKQLNWLEKNAPERHITKVVLYTGSHLVRRERDGVILCPAACLGV
jgi:predicted AAA+ superfamily ATPase